ncbi:radical SAM protein [Ectothiorhodospiraceae bacterium BW-2]|nr:radical SAM protein [Ectothiorhodospiraceae bacterium BW-2]
MINEKSRRILLANLSHVNTNQRVYPLGVAYCAAYAKQELNDAISVELYRAVEELSDAFFTQPADVVALSYFLWNAQLTYQIIKRIKKHSPKTVIIVGGVNYPDDTERQKNFLAENPGIDFYIYREGEISFVKLLLALERFDYDVSLLRASEESINGVHYLHDGRLIAGEPPLKIKNLDELPSPYLTGLLDKFIADPTLQPVMQFKRGCPFTCTFCLEGNRYYTKLGKMSIMRFMNEMKYVAQRLQGKPTLYLADANFGMYKDDIALAEEIAQVQHEFGWPEKVSVATGKNMKERVLKTSAILGGAVSLGASIQSSDPVVLSAIKRSNISTDALMEAGKQVEDSGDSSFTEIILGLPEDSVERHLGSIKMAVDASIEQILLYNLVLFPGSEMESNADREKYGLRTKYRIPPTSYGVYRFGDESFPCAEYNEVVVASNTLSYEEYIYCKQFHLSVGLFYEQGYFREITSLFKHMGFSVFDFIVSCHQHWNESAEDLQEIYHGIAAGIEEEYCWEISDLEEVVNDVSIFSLQPDRDVRNSLATAKAVGIVKCTDSIHKLAQKAAISYFSGKGCLTEDMEQYIVEAIRFSYCRKSHLLNSNYCPREKFSFRFDQLSAVDFKENPFDEIYRVEKAVLIEFRHTNEQSDFISKLNSKYNKEILNIRNIIFYENSPPPSRLWRKVFLVK